MPRLHEENCRPGSRLKNMWRAWEAGVVKRFINSFKVVYWNGTYPFVDRTDPYGEYTIYIPRSGGNSFPWEKLAFGYSLSFDTETEETTCTIYAGTLRIHGIGTVDFNETNVTLLAETCTVYAQCQRGSLSTGSILVSASPSETSNTHYRFPLYTFTYNTETGRHALDTVHHFGDIQLDTPLL